MKIGAIIQARTSSTRLPKKVLKELPFGSGITALQQIIRRLKKSKKIHEIIAATSQEKSDDAIVKIARKEGVPCFRGSLNDVLGRYYGAAQKNTLDVVVRITGDCPCVDPHIVDQVIRKHLRERGDLTCNIVKRSFADGLDVEVFNFSVLEEIHKKAKEPFEREHVTPYIYQHPSDYKIINIEASRDFYFPQRRITLDTAQDYALLCVLYGALYRQDKYFSARTIMKFFKTNPWLDWINAPSHA